MNKCLTTHVLDTALGQPAYGILIDLYKFEADGRKHIKQMCTNADGRTDMPILDLDAVEICNYELIFNTGNYLMKLHKLAREDLFLDIIPVRFFVQKKVHYHIPLLLSPFGYSTYRGS